MDVFTKKKKWVQGLRQSRAAQEVEEELKSRWDTETETKLYTYEQVFQESKDGDSPNEHLIKSLKPRK